MPGCKKPILRQWDCVWKTKAGKAPRATFRLFKADKLLHVIDACSGVGSCGVGSCGVTCQQKGLKCVVLEKSP